MRQCSSSVKSPTFGYPSPWSLILYVTNAKHIMLCSHWCNYVYAVKCRHNYRTDWRSAQEVPVAFDKTAAICSRLAERYVNEKNTRIVCSVVLKLMLMVCSGNGFARCVILISEASKAHPLHSFQWDHCIGVLAQRAPAHTHKKRSWSWLSFFCNATSGQECTLLENQIHASARFIVQNDAAWC